MKSSLWRVPILVGVAGGCLVIPALTGCGSEGPTGSGSEVAEISVTPASVSLQSLNETVNAVATPRAADGTSLPRRVQWASSNTAVATVTASGDLNDNAQIVARGNGTALISATTDGVTGGVEVTVQQTVGSFAFVSPPQDALLGGSSGTIQVAALDPGASPVGGAAGPVTLEVAAGSPGDLVGGPRSVDMVDGTAAFEDIKLDQLGSGYRLRATWDGRSTTSNPFSVVEAFDALELSNVPGAASGFLVDGFRSGAALNDFAVTSDQARVEVGVVDAAPSGINEVVVFAPDRRPALQAATWTSGVDTIRVALEAPVEIDVTIWVVRGPFASQSARALDAIRTTRSIWASERAGLVIDSVEVIDATGDPDASQFFRLTLCNSKDALESLIGKKAGTINVYYVETVDGGTDRGRACPIGGDHAIMAERSGDELLSHEIGHLLSLTHTDAITQFFDRTNVMHSASSTRRYLTEGQIFRQQFDPNSAINNVFGIRSAQGRSCPRDTSNGRCPAIEGRIFRDGSFPPTLVGAAGPVPHVGLESHANSIAHRWVETSCEMEENEGLTAQLVAGGPGAVAALAEVVAGDPDPDHRRAALDALALLGGRRAADIVETAASDPSLAEHARAAILRMRAAGTN